MMQMNTRPTIFPRNECANVVHTQIKPWDDWRLNSGQLQSRWKDLPARRASAKCSHTLCGQADTQSSTGKGGPPPFTATIMWSLLILEGKIDSEWSCNVNVVLLSLKETITRGTQLQGVSPANKLITTGRSVPKEKYFVSLLIWFLCLFQLI